MLRKYYKICDSLFSQTLGLMFQLNPPTLIFKFKYPKKYLIHSFFCFRTFVAIYYLDEEIVEVKIVRPWKYKIEPKKEFNMLVEIPLLK